MTIRDLVSVIARAQQAIHALRSLENIPDNAPATAVVAAPEDGGVGSRVPVEAGRVVQARALKVPRQPRRDQVRDSSRRLPQAKEMTPRARAMALGQRAREVVKTIKMPFARQELIAAVDDKQFDMNCCYGAISRWIQEGWLKKVATNQFAIRRPAGGNGPAASEPSEGGRLTIPGIDKPVETTRQTLERTLRERDEARATGKEGLAMILQDKANKLQGILDGQ